jgi:hypothetical protein
MCRDGYELAVDDDGADVLLDRAELAEFNAPVVGR